MRSIKPLMVTVCMFGLVACTGFIQIGSSRNKSLTISESDAPRRPLTIQCEPYTALPRTTLPALPDYDEGDSDESVIDGLSAEVLKLRQLYRDEGERQDRHHQDYLHRCRTMQ